MDGIIVSDPVAAATRQVDGYWYRDGITEISMGIGMLSSAALAFAFHHQLTVAADWISITAVFVSLGIAVGENRIKKTLRARYSYPRLGYLSERRGEPLSRRRKAFAVAFMAVLLVLPFVLIPVLWKRNVPAASLFGWMRWFPLVFAPFMLGGAIADYRRFKLSRLLVDGILTAVTGVACSLLIDAAFLPSAAFAAVCAVIKISLGTRTLATLVRTVPVASE